MSATPSTIPQGDEELTDALRTLVRLVDRQRLVERELALVYKGIQGVAEVLHNRAMRAAADA